jgi:hypothetical protein
LGARVEAIFSARLTMHTGSDSQSADDAHRLLPFPGAARVLKAARGMGSPEARFLVPVLVWRPASPKASSALLRERAVGSNLIEDHRLSAMVGREHDGSGGEE